MTREDGRKDFEVEVTGVDKEPMSTVVRESVKLRRIVIGEDRSCNEGTGRRSRRRNGTRGGRNEDVREKKRNNKRKRVRLRLLIDNKEWFTPKLVAVSPTQL
jgi:hypothetical protein